MFSYFDNDNYKHYEYECINTTASTGLKKYLSDTSKLYKKALKSTSAEFKEIDKINSNAMKLLNAYTLNAPQKFIGNDKFQANLEQMYKNYPITKEGIAIYVYSGDSDPATKRPLSEK